MPLRMREHTTAGEQARIFRAHRMAAKSRQISLKDVLWVNTRRSQSLYSPLRGHTFERSGNT